MTEVRDAIAAILDNMTLEQFVAGGGLETVEEKLPVSAAS
jgi:DNA-binding IscR family transcriptional regulator